MNIYEEINLDSKEYLLKEIDNKLVNLKNNEQLIERCYKEINILFQREYLFVIEYLYRYKKENPNTEFYFKGSINNLKVLHLLGLSKVDPLKYSLPYELYLDKELSIKVFNDDFSSVTSFIERNCKNFKIVAGNVIESDEEIRKIEQGNYLFIPCFATPESLDLDMKFKINSDFIFETVDDYRKYRDIYISINFSNKYHILNENISLDNVLENEYELKLKNILKPKTINDYVKIKCLSKSVHLWKNNQEELNLSIESIISNIEDIYDYLMEHSIDKTSILEIINLILTKSITSSVYLWNKYVELMKNHNCDDVFINTLKKVFKISGRGDSISECLFVLDKNSYMED